MPDQNQLARHWVLREVADNKVNELIIDLDLHRILARVLVARGIEGALEAKKYLSPELAALPDPIAFVDMAAACERIYEAIRRNEVIGIFGDYDVDGVTSTTLLWEFLEGCGAKVVATIPDRLREGYGLNIAGLDRLQAQDATVVVTVDCGITAHDEVEEAVRRGIDIIVIDHHTVSVQLPNAVAVINPHRIDCSRAARHMCAVGVVFNLCIALRRRLRESGFFELRSEPNLRHLLDLVALGTVADVVPLILDNRIFVHHGLDLIRERRRVGLNALLDVAQIETSKISASTLGFHLGPRINAAGRLEDAMQAVTLLRARGKTEAMHIAQRLDASNQSRRELEKEILLEACAEINASKEHAKAFVIVVGREQWHPGVVGIVASRLVEKYGKPAIVIGENGKGSGRSIPAFHLHEALCQVKETLESFGGHAHAVGVHVQNAGLSRFRDAINQHAQTTLSEDDLVRTLYYDGEIGIEDVNHDLLNALGKAAPFGRANPEPVFKLSGLDFKNIQELKGGHLRGRIGAGVNMPFVAFGMAEKALLFNKSAAILAVPEMNEWQGRREVQLRVKDIQAKQTSATAKLPIN